MKDSMIRASMFLKSFKSAAVVCVLLAAGSIVKPCSVQALPFNDDMVDVQPKTGQVMRARPAGVIPSGIDYPDYQKKEDTAALVNPVPADSISLAKGQRLFEVNCMPCHGSLSKDPWQAGVSGQKIGAPNLLDKLYRERTDGSIFGTIHFGGMAIMPAYGWKLSPTEHWDIINYLRKMQVTGPLLP